MLYAWHLPDESRNLPPLKLLDKDTDFIWPKRIKNGVETNKPNTINYTKAKMVCIV